MQRLQIVATIVVSFVLGVGVGSFVHTPKVQAQQDGPWQILHGNYGQSSFYAIKHNLSTGEVWVLNAERGNADSWIKLPEQQAKAKK